MGESSTTPPRSEDSLVKAWNVLTAPIVAVSTVVVNVLGEIAHEARARPMTWSAIFTLAGVMSFMVGQHHLGAIFLSCLGMLWMWLDAIENPLEGSAGSDEAQA